MDQERGEQPAPVPIEPGHVMSAKKWERIKKELVPQQK